MDLKNVLWTFQYYIWFCCKAIIFPSTRSFCCELVMCDLSSVGLLIISIPSSHLWCCKEVVFEFEQRALYIGSLRAKFVSAILGIPKCVWPSMNWYKMSPFQTSILPPRMHNKLTERERHFMQNNPFPTRSHAELGNDFNVCSNR